MAFARKKLDVPPPFVSMADIAFNLVLFFLILAKSQDEKQIEWDKARATGTKQIATSSIRATITVGKDDKTYLNGEEIGQRDLAPELTKIFENATDNRVVLLRIHKEALASTFEPIIEAVSQAGCDIAHALEEEQ